MQPSSIISSNTARRNIRISMTPLIDVVFILLLFFMLTSTFNRFNQLQIRTSQSGIPVVSDVRSEQVLIDESGALIIGGTKYTVGDFKLAEVLENFSATDSSLIVRAHANASVQVFVTALDHIKLHGVAKVKIAESTNNSPTNSQ